MTLQRSKRIFLVGTDTGVGKTTLTCQLVQAAHKLGLKALPFKPVQSGDEGQQSDAHRLTRAAQTTFPTLSAESIAPFQWTPPLAPGIAENPEPFLRNSPSTTPSNPKILNQANQHLETLEASLEPSLSLIEGAGGLMVPMPGGTWQLEWIQRFEAPVLLAARVGLGTINHSLLTIDRLRQNNIPVIGFVLIQSNPGEELKGDPSVELNPQIIATQSQVPHLATLPFSTHADTDLHSQFDHKFFSNLLEF